MARLEPTRPEGSAWYGPWHAVPFRPFPEPGEIIGHPSSFAFIEQPQTNGVAERFIRTLKEQAIYSRVFQDVEEVREAVRDSVEFYNSQWCIEKSGFLSPRQARNAWLEASTIDAAA